MKNATLLKAMMFLMLLAASQSTLAQTVIISPTGDGGFETGTTFAANGWTAVNSGSGNQWFCSNFVFSAGARSAYVSSTATGTNNNYTNFGIPSASRVQHFYRNVIFPAGQSQITLSFKWRNNGESGFDDIKVFLISTATTPVAGTALPGANLLAGPYSGQSTYQTATITLSSALAGTSQRLVFSWRNDNSGGSNPAGSFDEISLISCAPPSISASNNGPLCAGSSLDLSATSSASSFSWSGPNGFTSSLQNPSIASSTVASSGTYTVTATSGGCSASATTAATVNAATAISVHPADQTKCEGTNATFSVTATGTLVTYQWQDNSSGSFANIAGATSSSYSANGVTLGMTGRLYQCIVSGSCGVINSNSAALTVNAVPIGVATITSQSICSGSAITDVSLSTSNGVPGTTYSWSRTNTGTVTGITSPGSANPISGTLNNVTAGPLTTTFTITPATASCTGSSFTSAVTVNPSTAISTQPVAQTNCEGTNATYSVTAGGASLTYQWQDNSSGSFADISGATNASLVVSSVTVGMSGWQYMCIVSGICGVLNSNSVALTVNAVPVVSASSSPANGIICGTGSVTLTASGASGYSWAPGGSTAASIVVSPLTTTSYTVTGTTTGCSATASQNVTVNPGVTALASASLAAVCQNGNSVLTAAGSNSTDYAISSIAYSAPLGSGTSVVTGDDNVSGSIALPFTFNFYGINYNNLFVYSNGFVELGTSSSSTTVYGQTLPSATAPNNIIAGILSDLNAAANTITTFTTGSSPNQVFTIYFNNVKFYCSSCTGNKRGNTNFQIRLYEKTNIVEIHMHDVSNNSTTSAALKTMGIENAGGTAAKVPAGRNGSDGNWTVSTPEAWRFTPSGGTFTYSWLPATYLTDATSSNPSAINMQANQNYVVTITEQNGCTASSAVPITVNPLPTVTITPGGATDFCAGGSVTLTAPAGLSSYSWNTSPVQTTQSITVNTAANYSVTGTNSNSCSNVASQAVIVYDTLPATISVIGDTNLCIGQTTSSLVASGAGATGTYLWNTNETTELIIAYSAGNYFVTATDIHGCFHHQLQVITESVAPANPIVVPLGSTTLCSDGTTTTSVVLNTTNYTSGLLWSTNETTTSINVDYADLFSVTYTDANGCFSFSNAIVTEVKIYSTDPTDVVSNATNNSICPGNGTTLSVVGGSLGDDAVWTWYEGSCSGAAIGTGTSLLVNPAATATYFVRAEGPCNNTNCAQVMVTVKSLSVDPSTASPSAPILCGSGNSNLSVSGGSLGTGANWVWYEGGCGSGASIGTGTSLSVTPLTTTTYYVRAEGDCNISNCAQATVTVKTLSVDPTLATNNAPFNEICNGSPVQLNVSGGSLGSDADWVWYEGGCGNGASVAAGPSPSAVPSGGGIHTYYVRAEGYCNITNCVTVNVTVKTAGPSSTVSSITAPASACTGNTGIVSVNNVTNATYYSWSGPAGVLFNGNAGSYQTLLPNVTTTFGSLPGGSSGYSICVFGGNACGQSNTICKWVRGKVSAPGPISGSSTGCPNASSTYSVTPVGGAESYTWTVIGNDATLNGTSLITITSALPSVLVDFAAPFSGATLQVYASLNCGYNSSPRNLAISKNPAMPGTMSGNSYVCPLGSATFSVSPVSGAASYSWTCSVPGAVISPAGNSASIFFPGNIPGGSSVCVTALSACGFASTTRCKGIASGLPNTPANISGPALGQCGQTGVSYTIPPVSSATSYLWTISNGSASFSGPNNLSSVTLNFTGNLNTVQLSVYASNGCGNGGTRSLSILGKPGTPAAIAGNNSVCNGSIESYVTGGSSGANLLTWTVPATATILGGQGSSNILVMWGSGGGLLKVYAANDCGTSAFTSLPVTVTCRQSQMQNTLESNIKVYPNPAHDNMKVEISSLTSDRTSIELINTLGEIVYRSEVNIHEGTNLVEVNLENMAKGFYNLSIQGSSINSQHRVVVE